MSFEGYEQQICAKGHYFIDGDIYSLMYGDEPKTCYCGSEVVWSNLVDITNCDETGYIPSELFTHAAPGKPAPFAIPDDKLKTYQTSYGMFFIHNNEKVVFPTYQIAEYDRGPECFGLGDTYTQAPCPNLCD